jgi:hypothetical protein
MLLTWPMVPPFTFLRPAAQPPPCPLDDYSAFVLLCQILGGSYNEQRKNTIFATPDTIKTILTTAESERVLPALHEAVVLNHAADLPKSYRAILAVQYEANRRRNLMMHRALIALGEAAASVRLEFAVLKGAAWVMEDISGAPWRWLLDIDLLVDPRQYGRTPQLLEALGCQRAFESRRFDVNFHHAPYRYPDGDFTIEVHRHLGWKHALLPPDGVLACARRVAPGLLLPAPWHRAFHAIIHWQVQDCGRSRATTPLKDILEVARFLARPDVDWAALAAHARKVRATDACESAVALASALLGAPVPREIATAEKGERHVVRALVRRASPLRTWFATQLWRAATLWRCEKVAYRTAISGGKPAIVAMVVWSRRIAQLPILAVRLIGIIARALFLWARGRVVYTEKFIRR